MIWLGRYLSVLLWQSQRMNELMLDLATAAPWLCRAPRRPPDALTVIWCRPTRAGGLMFTWQPPPGRVAVEGYRLERTRDGKEYEEMAETEAEAISLPPVPLNEPWFYRVCAFNSRGQGAMRWVHFYLRRLRDPMFLKMPVRPGLRVVINELIREGGKSSK